MTLPPALLATMRGDPCELDSGLEPKRGEAIFENTDYPRTWDGLIGQTDSKAHLRVAIASAKRRQVRLDHSLLTGMRGLGKSTFATMVAYQLGVGLQRTSGPLTVEKFLSLTANMRDRDILFSDEVHRLVEGNRNRADWILPWLTEGVVYTDRGAVKTPNITLLGATTDAGKLPDTLLERFLLQERMEPYTEGEATLIGLGLGERMKVEVDEDEANIIATAGDCNPRVMRRLISTLRDQKEAGVWCQNWDQVFKWSGVTEDGLSIVAEEMLILLNGEPKQTAAIGTIQKQLSESGPLDYHEQLLLRRRLIEISGQGRRLTPAGRMRARGRAAA